MVSSEEGESTGFGAGPVHPAACRGSARSIRLASHDVNANGNVRGVAFTNFRAERLREKQGHNE